MLKKDRFKKFGIFIAVLITAVIAYILIFTAVTAFNKGITVDAKTIANTTFIEPDTKEMLLFGNNNLLINNQDNTIFVSDLKIIDSIIKYEVITVDEVNTYYIKFINNDKIYSSQLNKYLYKWWGIYGKN